MVEITEEDKGKRVVNRDGNTVGMVTAVEGERVFVDPNPGLTDKIKSKLGWEAVSEEDYAISERDIDTVTDDELRLSH